MKTAADVMIGLVALLHAYFLVLEMFLWNTPFGRSVFRTTPEFAGATKSLAANQGLYNGFLAAGLAWGLAMGDAGLHVKLFFLACVIIGRRVRRGDRELQDPLRASASGHSRARGAAGLRWATA